MDLPRVYTDASAMDQIVLNLVTNARDAMPGGGTLRIQVESEVIDEGYRANHPWLNPATTWV